MNLLTKFRCSSDTSIRVHLSGFNLNARNVYSDKNSIRGSPRTVPSCISAILSDTKTWSTSNKNVDLRRLVVSRHQNLIFWNHVDLVLSVDWKAEGPPFKNMPLTSCRWDVRKALVSTYLFIHLCLAKMKILGENCNIFGNNAILRYYDLIMFSATFFAEKGYFFRQLGFLTKFRFLKMQKGAEQLSVGRWTDFDQTRFSNQVSMPITQKVYSHAIYLKNFRNNKAMWVKLEKLRNE